MHKRKKNCNFKSIAYTPLETWNNSFPFHPYLSALYKGLLWNRKAGTGCCSGKNLPPSPFSSSLSLRGLFVWGGRKERLVFHFKRKSSEQIFKMKATTQVFKRQDFYYRYQQIERLLLSNANFLNNSEVLLKLY